MLLDSDCAPVTLFEVEDLWQEAQRLQPHSFPGEATTSSCAGDELRPTFFFGLDAAWLNEGRRPGALLSAKTK